MYKFHIFACSDFSQVLIKYLFWFLCFLMFNQEKKWETGNLSQEFSHRFQAKEIIQKFISQQRKLSKSWRDSCRDRRTCRVDPRVAS